MALGSMSFLSVLSCLLLCAFISTLYRSGGYVLILLSKAFNLISAAFEALNLGTSRGGTQASSKILPENDSTVGTSQRSFHLLLPEGKRAWNRGQLSMKFNFPKWWLHLATARVKWEVRRTSKGLCFLC